jgi:hypothetical protein
MSFFAMPFHYSIVDCTVPKNGMKCTHPLPVVCGVDSLDFRSMIADFRFFKSHIENCKSRGIFLFLKMHRFSAQGPSKKRHTHACGSQRSTDSAFSNGLNRGFKELTCYKNSLVCVRPVSPINLDVIPDPIEAFRLF